MNNRKRCPECGAFDTEQVHVEWMADMLEEVRICNDCPAQYTNNFDLFDKRTDEVAADE